MSWAEFQLRLIGFNRVREWEMSMTREVSYEVHTLKYMFGKKHPPKKDRFWPIGEVKKGLGEEHKEAFKQRMLEYLKKKNG